MSSSTRGSYVAGEEDDGFWASASSSSLRSTATATAASGGDRDRHYGSRLPRKRSSSARGGGGGSSSNDIIGGGSGGPGGFRSSSGNLGQIAAVAAADNRHTLGPRAKPGLEVNFSAGVTVNLVRHNALGETGPGPLGRWIQRCRISAAGLRAGGVREPSDGWGSPPPQHRGWLSVSSLTVGLPPYSSLVDGVGGGGDGGFAETADVGWGPGPGASSTARNYSTTTSGVDRSSKRRRARGGGGGDRGGGGFRPADRGGSGQQHYPPWLVCRAATAAGYNPGATASSTAGTAAAAAASYGSDADDPIGGSASARSRAPPRGASGACTGGGNGGGKFLDVKVAGRADSTAGTGSCASLVMCVGEVEAWALGGAATRWVERLGPQVTSERLGRISPSVGQEGGRGG